MEVITTDEFAAWYHDPGLDEKIQDAARDIIEVLAQEGLALKFPYQSSLKGSKHGCRELRKSVGRLAELRIAFNFDPERNAVVILAGNKAGDGRFYDWFVPEADKIWEQYLKELEEVKKQNK